MATDKKSLGETDDPSRAPESGDPKESGRSHGEVIDNSGAPAGARKDGKGGDTDFESGRHGAK
jgi:hypothetical protein